MLRVLVIAVSLSLSQQYCDYTTFSLKLENDCPLYLYMKRSVLPGSPHRIGRRSADDHPGKIIL